MTLTQIVNGRPYTRIANTIIDCTKIGCPKRRFEDDFRLITDLDNDKIKICDKWVKENIRTSGYYNLPACVIKHHLKHDTEIYVTENQFIDLMIRNGYESYFDNYSGCFKLKCIAEQNRKRKKVEKEKYRNFIQWIKLYKINDNEFMYSKEWKWSFELMRRYGESGSGYQNIYELCKDISNCDESIKKMVVSLYEFFLQKEKVIMFHFRCDGKYMRNWINQIEYNARYITNIDKYFSREDKI